MEQTGIKLIDKEMLLALLIGYNIYEDDLILDKEEITYIIELIEKDVKVDNG